MNLPFMPSIMYSHFRELVVPEIPVKVRNAVQTFPSGSRSSDIEQLA